MHSDALRPVGMFREALQDGAPPGPPLTLDALRPLCRRAGMTRIADITGLDILGLPAVQTIRPEALSETTSLGRGREIGRAAIGAVMETLERYFSERIAPHRVREATADEIAVPKGWFDAMAAQPGYAWRAATIPWVVALRLDDLSDCHVPLALVDTCYTDPPPAHGGQFARTTTGLACHPDPWAAVSHGLCECIERDAMTRAFATHGFFETWRIDHAAIDHSPTRELLALCARHGLGVAMWQAPSPTGLPVIWCQVVETGAFEPLVVLPTEGYAAAPSFGAAAHTALLEALVTRAGVVSGGREDQFRRHYDVTWDSTIARSARALILEGGPRILPQPETASADPKQTHEAILAAVRASDLGPALAVPVGHDADTGVHCVRVLLSRGQMQTFER